MSQCHVALIRRSCVKVSSCDGVRWRSVVGRGGSISKTVRMFLWARLGFVGLIKAWCLFLGVFRGEQRGVDPLIDIAKTLPMFLWGSFCCFGRVRRGLLMVDRWRSAMIKIVNFLSSSFMLTADLTLV